jgi:hypothetical protein
VDAALVRSSRAADAVAIALRGVGRPAALEVESAGASLLHWDIGDDGTWTFRQGSWSDEFGRRHAVGLLRPALRGIARAARPDHEAVLDVVVRDVELAAGNIIAKAEERLPQRPEPTSLGPEQLLERTWPGLSQSDRGALWKMTTLVDVQAGVTLMVKDHRGRDVLFLLDGMLEVDTGNDRIVLGPGSVVGERAAMGNGVRSATVQAVTDSVLLGASGDELASLPDAVREQLDRKVVVR